MQFFEKGMEACATATQQAIQFAMDADDMWTGPIFKKLGEVQEQVRTLAPTLRADLCDHLQAFVNQNNDTFRAGLSGYLLTIVNQNNEKIICSLEHVTRGILEALESRVSSLEEASARHDFPTAPSSASASAAAAALLVQSARG
mmetsp:Transcript_33614/g.96213  ORF Transcript_33614/g.96213 Transcript_33614/m.96213 type:complete len:144 (-) Transcript_33614:31-462(-)